MATDIDDSGLLHEDPKRKYDPVKAHEYYMRTRKLKGHKPKDHGGQIKESPVIKVPETFDDLLNYKNKIQLALQRGKTSTGRVLTDAEKAELQKALDKVQKEMDKRDRKDALEYSKKVLPKAKTQDLQKLMKQIVKAQKTKKGGRGQPMTEQDAKDVALMKKLITAELKRRGENG